MGTTDRFIVHDVTASLTVEDAPEIKYHHERHSVGVCPWCDFIRVDNICQEFLRRLEVSDHVEDEIIMWSLGTSLKDSKFNRKVLIERWRIFSRRMDRCEDWTPIFRVVEAGRRGYLHLHVAVLGFASHAHVTSTWRSSTGEASNVNFSRSSGGADTPTLVRYLVKYMAKKGSTYRWMGPFYGLGDRSRSIVQPGGVPSVFAGATPYKWYTLAYVERRSPQRKLIDVPAFTP